MRPASGKASSDVGFRDVVTALFDTLGDTADGEFGRWQPKVVKFDWVAGGFGLLEQLGVGGAAERAFEAEGDARPRIALKPLRKKWAGGNGSGRCG